MNYKLDFYTQYHQFFLSDKGSASDFDDNDNLNSSDRIAGKKDVLDVITECYGPVKGEIDLLSKSSTATDFKTYDHVVEQGIEIHSGTLEVLDCPYSSVVLSITLRPGTYRVRVYSSNLASVEGDEGDDYYKIEIWPDSNMERKVLKQYMPKK